MFAFLWKTELGNVSRAPCQAPVHGQRGDEVAGLRDVQLQDASEAEVAEDEQRVPIWDQSGDPKESKPMRPIAEDCRHITTVMHATWILLD